MVKARLNHVERLDNMAQSAAKIDRAFNLLLHDPRWCPKGQLTEDQQALHDAMGALANIAGWLRIMRNETVSQLTQEQ